LAARAQLVLCVLDIAVERDASRSDGSAILEDSLNGIGAGSEARFGKEVVVVLSDQSLSSDLDRFDGFTGSANLDSSPVLRRTALPEEAEFSAFESDGRTVYKLP